MSTTTEALEQYTIEFSNGYRRYIEEAAESGRRYLTELIADAADAHGRNLEDVSARVQELGHLLGRLNSFCQKVAQPLTTEVEAEKDVWRWVLTHGFKFIGESLWHAANEYDPGDGLGDRLDDVVTKSARMFWFSRELRDLEIGDGPEPEPHEAEPPPAVSFEIEGYTDEPVDLPAPKNDVERAHLQEIVDAMEIDSVSAGDSELLVGLRDLKQGLEGVRLQVPVQHVRLREILRDDLSYMRNLVMENGSDATEFNLWDRYSEALEGSAYNPEAITEGRDRFLSVYERTEKWMDRADKDIVAFWAARNGGDNG